jgi:uncharacterized protein YlxW (UPF0749 family)
MAHETREAVRAFIAKNPNATIRAIQRGCGLSSPSQVVFHLSKIDEERYQARADPELITENRKLRKQVRELEAKLERISRDLSKYG